MQKQIMHIHGGNVWSTHEEYLEYLKEKTITGPLPEIKDRWKDKYVHFLGVDWEVMQPEMPCARNATYDAWKIWFEKYVEYVKDGVIIVGHSLGATFIAKYLSENILGVRIKQLHLVAGPYGCTGFDFSADVSVIQEQCDEIYIWHSTDDDVVAYKNADEFTKALPKATLKSFKDRGHFLQPEFQELMDIVSEV